MRKVLLAALAALALLCPGSASAQEALGGLQVRGPGVVTVADRWFHLLGVEGLAEDATCARGAAEYACGVVAMAKLAELAAENVFHCQLEQFADDSRWWGTCAPYDPVMRRAAAWTPSLNQEWVRSGWARAHTLHSPAYVEDEAAARAAGLGLWAGAMPAPPANRPDRIEGAARVLDANTLVVDGVPVRLDGVDGPELAHECSLNDRRYRCGKIARGFLMDLVVGKRIACTLCRPAGDDRDFGLCTEADGGDGAVTLNERMISAGWAVADRRGGGERYLPLEGEAQRARRGMWVGPFIAPSRWRMGQR